MISWQIQRYVFKKFDKIFSKGFVVISGRNFLGRICVQHKGGGVKTKYRNLDIFRNINQFGFILRIFKDYYRTGFIGLILYEDGLLNFILLAEGIEKGSRIFSGRERLLLKKKNLGFTQKLININLFDIIHNIEIFPLSGFKIVRSAGCGAKIVSKDYSKSVLKLASGWQIKLPSNSLGVLGVVSNITSWYKVIKKAGINRKKGIRPTVRGVIKNPCDHPHGGGEGKGSPPVAQVSPWGWLCKGTPTKNKKIDRLKRKLFKKIKK